MIRTFLTSLFLLVAGLNAQCNPGIHPPGVISLAGAGCNEVTTGPAPWASLAQTPRVGGPIQFSFKDAPHLSAVCPSAFAVTVLSIGGYIPGGVQIGASPTCRGYVPPQGYFQHLVRMCNGCQSVTWLILPNNPAFVGLTINAQTIGFASTPALNWWAGNPIQFTVQP